MEAKQHFLFKVKEGKLVVSFALEKFDASVTEEFKHELDTIWDDSIHAAVVDMSRLSLIDSSGVGALLSLRKRLGAGEASITLIQPQPMVVRVLKMLRLQRVFHMEG